MTTFAAGRTARLLRASKLVILVSVLVLGALATAAIRGRLSNGQVPQGGSATFAYTSQNTAPSFGPGWQIFNPSGTDVGSSQNARGWNVSYSNPNLTVSAPSSATIATGYSVRHFNPVYPDTSPHDASFDVISGGGSAPAAPTGLTATAGNAQVSLTWSASAGATSYTVKRSTTSGSGYTAIQTGLTTTTFTDTTAINGTTYYFVVTASNSSGESANSNQASATPVGPPPAPTNLYGSSGNHQVALSWNASSGATTYTVKRSTTNGSGYASVQSGLTTTAYTNTGLTNGTTYYFVVTASSANGESGNSNQAIATPTNGLVAPPNVTATSGYGDIQLMWGSVSGASGYNIKRSLVSGGPYSLDGTSTTTSFDDTNLTAGTAYYYVVSATNSSGEGPNSAEVSGVPGTYTGAHGYLSGYVDGSLSLTDVSEIASAQSTSIVNGSLVTANRHVLQLTLQLPANAGWTNPNVNDPTPFANVIVGGPSYMCWDTTHRLPGTPGQASIWTLNPPNYLGDYNPPSFTVPNGGFGVWNTGADGTNDTCIPNDVRPGGTDYKVYVVGPADAGIGGSPSSVQITQNGNSQPSIAFVLTPGQNVLVQEAATGPLPNGTLQVVLATHKWCHTLRGYINSYNFVPDGTGGGTYYYYNTEYWWDYVESTTYTVYSYNLRRSHGDSVAIDSRKVYGTPNLDGEISLDANSPLRNPTFNPYFYNGGLFVGNMPAFGNDASGTSRVQTYGDIAANSQTIWSILTCFDLGNPASATNDAPIRVFTPPDNDPNIGVLPTQVSWATGWTGGTVGGQLVFTSTTPANQYCNWKLLNPSTTAVKAALMLNNEVTSVPEWRYFASPTWESLQTSWPGNDSRPRVWMVDAPPTSGWVQ